MELCRCSNLSAETLFFLFFLFMPLSEMLKFDIFLDTPGSIASSRIKEASFIATEIIPQRHNSGFFFYL